ncbi:small ubiquitin-related modifier 3 [Gadus morhua]|nr:small ubiquitin-related modifier 3-like [Gadus morhua]
MVLSQFRNVRAPGRNLTDRGRAACRPANALPAAWIAIRFHIGSEVSGKICTMSEEKPKEGVKTENDHINLKVAGQDGSVVQFKIKRHTPLSKLMKAYCERQGLAIRQIRFRFDGQPINETDTPAQLEMEDEDTIDVFQQQTGGSFS